MNEKMLKTEQEWRKILAPEQYHVLREKGTERPFSGKYLKNKKKGEYICAACGAKLFSSDTKFESGTGWLSFYDVIKGNVKLKEDNSLGIRRIEVLCAKCGSHLGHVFDDAPEMLTGKRYCINSCALNFNDTN